MVKKFHNASTVRLSIQGMHCGNCAAAVEKKYQKTDGVYSVVVNLNTNSAVVAYDNKKLQIDDIVHVLDGTAFGAHVIDDVLDTFNKKADSKPKLIKLTVAIALTIVLFLISKLELPQDLLMRNILCLCLAVPVMFYCGLDFLVGGYKSIKNGSANMDVLVSVGTLIAFFYSVYLTISNAGPAVFETCALLISFISFGEYIENRAKNKTNKAVEGLIGLIPDFAKALKPGDKINVVEGNNIPCDGKIVSGKAYIDESMLTGESDLQIKDNGDAVTGGSYLQKGNIEVEVTHAFSESVLAKIVRAVSDAQNTKAPVQRIADKISGIFVPIVLIITVVTFAVWMIVSSGDFKFALMCACSITIVACPCALVLATPTALTVGMGRGAELGVVLRSGEVLELLCKIKNFGFDKTGTLTMSNLEANSAAAKVLRPDAKETIAYLNKSGNNTFMVSGDTKKEAYRVADELGFDHKNVVYGADPISKKDYVLKMAGKDKFAYVGDGINDAPVLAAADVGITLESGTDIALETGSVVLMHNKLKDVITAIRLSKATMRKIKQNLFWALIYNVVVIPLAVFGIMIPALCGAVHAVSSLFVVFNALTLRRFK